MSIRKAYEELGVTGFYSRGDYTNPQAAVVHKIVKEKCSHYNMVIDLACGNGEVTLALPSSCDVVGIDPYLFQRYREKTKKPCLTYGFAELAKKLPPLTGFDAVICSFALHLADKPIFATLLYNLSLMSRDLVVIGPTKMPVISHWAWTLAEREVIDRVHYRRFVHPPKIKPSEERCTPPLK